MAINWAQDILFKELGISVWRYCQLQSGCDFKQMKREWAKEKDKHENAQLCVVSLAGGNFNDKWGRVMQKLRIDMAKNFQDVPMMILPQSTKYADASIEKKHAQGMKHPDSAFCARDKASYEWTIKSQFKSTFTRIFHTPDIAFMLGTLPKPAVEQQRDVLWLERTDGEKAAYELPTFPEGVSHYVEDWFTWKVMDIPAWETWDQFVDLLAKPRTLNGLEFLARGRVVVTDRLHGHILCTLMGHPHVVLDNVYRKLGNYLDTWTGGVSNIMYTTDAQMAMRLAMFLLSRYKDESHFDKNSCFMRDAGLTPSLCCVPEGDNSSTEGDAKYLSGKCWGGKYTYKSCCGGEGGESPVEQQELASLADRMREKEADEDGPAIVSDPDAMLKEARDQQQGGTTSGSSSSKEGNSQQADGDEVAEETEEDQQQQGQQEKQQEAPPAPQPAAPQPAAAAAADIISTLASDPSHFPNAIRKITDAQELVPSLRLVLLTAMKQAFVDDDGQPIRRGIMVGAEGGGEGENKGDMAINWAQDILFKELGIDIIWYCQLQYNCDFGKALETIERSADDKSPVAVMSIAGGNFNDFSPMQELRVNMSKAFPDQPVFMLPQSVVYNDAKLLKRHADGMAHDRSTMFARDLPSYTKLQSGPFKDAFKRIYLVPDIAYMLGMRQDLELDPPVHDLLWLKRVDNERQRYKPPVFSEGVDFVVEDWFPYMKTSAKWTDWSSFVENLAEPRTINGFKFLSRAHVVVTDRLHGHILMTLLDKPHVVLDNKYRKLGNYLDTWTGGLSNVLYTDSPDTAIHMGEFMLTRYRPDAEFSQELCFNDNANLSEAFCCNTEQQQQADDTPALINPQKCFGGPYTREKCCPDGKPMAAAAPLTYSMVRAMVEGTSSAQEPQPQPQPQSQSQKQDQDTAAAAAEGQQQQQTARSEEVAPPAVPMASQAELNALGSRMDTITAKVTDVDKKEGDVEGRVDRLEKSLAELAGTVKTEKGKRETVESSVSALTADLQKVTGKVDGLDKKRQTDADSVKGEIKGIKQQMETERIERESSLFAKNQFPFVAALIAWIPLVLGLFYCCFRRNSQHYTLLPTTKNG